MPYNEGPYGIQVNIKGFLQKIWRTDPQNMEYEPPPPFMPCEPFLLGVGVVFYFLIITCLKKLNVSSNFLISCPGTMSLLASGASRAYGPSNSSAHQDSACLIFPASARVSLQQTGAQGTDPGPHVLGNNDKKAPPHNPYPLN